MEIAISAMPPGTEELSSLTPRTTVHTHIRNANAKTTRTP